MLKSMSALAAGALTLLLVSSTFDTAEARDRGGARGSHGGGHARALSGGGRSFGHHRSAGRHHGHRHHGHRHHRYGRIGRGLAIGVPLGVYGAYAYSNSCDWVYRKAVITGSGYWWSRYEACVEGY